MNILETTGKSRIQLHVSILTTTMDSVLVFPQKQMIMITLTLLHGSARSTKLELILKYFGYVFRYTDFRK